jgi:hypothetical protein
MPVDVAAAAAKEAAQPRLGSTVPTVTLTMASTSFVLSQAPTTTVHVSCASACGAVDFRIDGNEWGTIGLLADGTYTTYGFPAVSVGNHTLQVNYLGNATYAAASSNAVQFTVLPSGATVPTVTLTMASTSFPLSQAPTTMVQVSCDSACGAVDFRIDGNEWGTIGLLPDGTYTTYGLPEISVGNHTLQVNYLGNATYAAASSNAVPFTVLAVTVPAVTLTMASTSFVLSQAPTTHVQVSCDSACGAVDFRIDGYEWGTIGLLGNGTYTTYGFPTVSVGNHTLQVNYLGNANYAAAQSNAVAFTVQNVQATPLADAPLTGVVRSGTAGIDGAHVYLFAAGTSGYGGASVPLLSAANTGLADAVGPYVVTASDGSFTLTGDYSCTSGQQLYLYALGGDSGYGPNPSAGLLAALGPCPTAATTVTVNEVTTIAAAYAFAGFATDATHVSSSGTALAQVGVANAFANAGNLATLATGVALATTPAGNGTVPQQQINTLANLLAGCVNSAGSSSAGCSGLFADALANGTSGAAPTDTATAAINIAHNPGTNVKALYALASSTSVFSPVLSYPYYKDLTIVLQFTGGGLTYYPGCCSGANGQASDLAMDGLGNVWVWEGNQFGRFSSLGAATTSSQVSNSGTVVLGRSIAVDPSNNVWVVSSDAIYEVSNSGTLISPLTGYATVGTGNSSQAYTGLAIDGTGNAWATQVSGNVTEVSNGGTLLSPSGGYVTGGTSTGGKGYLSPSPVIDGGGNVLLSNVTTASGQFVKLSNSGAVLPSTGDLGCGTGVIAIDSAQRVWGASQTSTVCGTTSVGTEASYSAGIQGAWLSDVAVDGAGNVWSPSRYNTVTLYYYGVAEFASSGNLLSPPDVNGGIGDGGFGSDRLYLGSHAVIDGSGNVWVTNYANALDEIVGVAVPVVTPLSVGVKNNTLGTRP